MSALRLRSLPALRAHRPSPVARSVALRSMATRHGNDPEVLQKEKARNLRGEQDSSAPHKEHAPGWNEHLASDAEANVKADQAGPSGKPGKELQDATVGRESQFNKLASPETDIPCQTLTSTITRRTARPGTEPTMPPGPVRPIAKHT
ncbi:hypothetical protein L202_00581 [Cryptococcus amylolentus CBS 6039]|uniref:Uncharacterized protein n=1 Tax=Cryptococcus amylolentus CBS 6039 TaxID=1295533 RepID=A0A1E3I8K7_9TREE|nr:hypothetical protein L202_00581 [Cryptococcus amylolentus CBS 6039]ODN84685.1 hypothetical protein L202_00581 [Cryptococcus amylolentus CBS 6039]